MNEEQQIEEMATAISNYADKYDWELFEFECENLAIVLHNLGYRKVDDENYVGREWHDEQVLILAGEIDELKEQLAEYQNPIDKFIKDRKKQARKETAREILQCLYDKCYEFQNSRGGFAHIIPLDILTLAKQYGVEVEE